MENTIIPLQARQQRGNLPSLGEPYGKSLLGAPLLYFPAELAPSESGLIIAGTHGDETAAVVALSCALRTLFSGQRRHHVILAVNRTGVSWVCAPMLTASTSTAIFQPVTGSQENRLPLE